MIRPALPLLALLISVNSLSGAIAQDRKPATKKANEAPTTKEAKTAERTPDPFTSNLHIIVEYIEVEHEAFSEWLLENSLKADATELRREVQRWVKEGDAGIVETTVVHARSGQRAKVESIEEVIYPTEYGPAEMPSHPTVQDGDEIPISPPTGTAFETRNVGVTLEVDALISEDENYIDLNLAPEMVQMIDILEWETRSNDEEASVQFPLFHTAKATTQLTLKKGVHGLIGTLRLPEPVKEDREDAMILLFVRADTN